MKKLLFIFLLLSSCGPHKPIEQCKTTVNVKFTNGDVDVMEIPVRSDMIILREQGRIPFLSYYSDITVKFVASNVRSFTIIKEVCQ